MRVFIVCLAAVLGLSAADTPVYCVGPQSLTSTFCNSPPVVPDLDLSQYTGFWYQIYTSGTPPLPTSPECATSNYTLSSEGNVDDLSCHFPPGAERVKCRRATGSRLVGAKKPQMQMKHGADLEGSYNVAAVLGDAESGYEATAIYSCAESREGPVQGIVLLARDPRKPDVAKDQLIKRMACLGYPVEDDFEPTRHEGCKYYTDSGGYDEVEAFGEEN